MTDISVIVTAHREGVIAGATARSALAAIDHARTRYNLDIEIITVLDRCDETTETALTSGFGDRARILHVNEGDPGQSRNRGVEAAKGRCVAFLDGDDLWSYNWLSQAWEFIQHRPDAIAHSECNVTFGNEHNVWWHVDSEGVLFDEEYLQWGNYWDALSFAQREIYLKFPFKKNDLQRGFGHEDWHWNCLTRAAGIAHKPVPNTVHFKRRRIGSQMSLVALSDSVIWPLEKPEKIVSDVPVHLCVGAAFSGAERFLQAIAASPTVSVTADLPFWSHDNIRDFRQTIRDYRRNGTSDHFWLDHAPTLDDITVRDFLRLFVSQDRPVVHFDPSYAVMPAAMIEKLFQELPETSKVVVLLRNPLDRACEEVCHKAFVQGGARGQITDEMTLAVAKTMPTLMHATSAAAEKWKAVFGERARIQWFDQDLTEALRATSEFLGIAFTEQVDPVRADDTLLPSLTPRQKSLLADLVLRDTYELDLQYPGVAGRWTEEIRNYALSARNEKPKEEKNGDLKRLLRLMESIGDNCEFGFIQRYEAYEPSSLFRWSVTPVDKLTSFLNFPQKLFHREDLLCGSSDLVLDNASGFHFHSDLTVLEGETRRFLSSDEGFDSIYESEKNKIEYLEQKFFRNLKNTPGIYVYKRNHPVSEEEVAPLYQAIRRYNPAHILLCVTQSDEFRLEQRNDGFYWGTITKFAEYHTANIVEQEAWHRLLFALSEQPDVKALLNRMFA